MEGCLDTLKPHNMSDKDKKKSCQSSLVDVSLAANDNKAANN